MALLAKRIGLSCQIPKKRDYRACSEARIQWLKRVSKIEEHAKQSKADVMYFDACSVHPEGTKVKSWGKKGQAPVVNHKLSKNRINVLCAISQDGSMIYTRTKLNINSDQFISFLQKILDSKPKKKIFLILDNADLIPCSEIRFLVFCFILFNIRGANSGFLILFYVRYYNFLFFLQYKYGPTSDAFFLPRDLAISVGV